MAERQRQETVDGTLIQGDDGKMYFIPDKDIERYRIPQEIVDEATKDIKELSAAGADEVLPGSRLAVSVHGPIGRRPATASNTIYHVDPVAVYGPRSL